MSKTINIGQPLFNNIEGHPFMLGPQGPYNTKEEAKSALISFYESIDDIPDGQECIIAGVRFVWKDNDLYENLAVKVISENETDLNSYRTPGTYRFNSIRNNNFANLPINNNNPNASITGELVVYSSVEGTTTYRSIIGQVLFLSNAEGHETKIYTRSANKTSKDGGATYVVTWGDWQVCQGMKEVGVVNSYDSFIDNGMYSGVYNNNGVIETFIVITINDYTIKQHKSVSQLKYALNANTNKSELSIRVGGGQEFKWGEWKLYFDEENITAKITNLQNQLNALTKEVNNKIDTLVVNDLTTGGADKALSAEMGKALSEELSETVKAEDTDEIIENIEPNIVDKMRALENNHTKFKEETKEAINNINPIVINGDVTNAPDEEDLTSDENKLLKLKDRNNLNGMGHIILRKNKTFAEQLTQTNTIYEIRYDFDLNGEEITIPENCVLKFEGGSLSNGIIKGNYTEIHAITGSTIFQHIKLVNKFTSYTPARLSWWNVTDENSDEELTSLSSFSDILIDRDCSIGSSISFFNHKSLHINGGGSTIKFNNTDLFVPYLFYIHSCESVFIENLNMDYCNKQVVPKSNSVSRGIYIYNNCRNIKIEHCEISNYGKKTTEEIISNFVAIEVKSYKGSTIKINNNTFKNLHTRTTGRDSGSLRAIVIDPVDWDGSHVYKDSGVGAITSCRFENIFNIGEDGRYKEGESDAIYYRGSLTEDDGNSSSFRIDNCSFYNCAKRCIKIQGNGVCVTNIILDVDEYMTENTSTEQPVSAIDFQTGRGTVRGVRGAYNGTIVKAVGESIIIDDVNVSVISAGLAFNVGAEKVSIINSYIRGANVFVYFGRDIPTEVEVRNTTIECKAIINKVSSNSYEPRIRLEGCNCIFNDKFHDSGLGGVTIQNSSIKITEEFTASIALGGYDSSLIVENTTIDISESSSLKTLVQGNNITLVNVDFISSLEKSVEIGVSCTKETKINGLKLTNINTSYRLFNCNGNVFIEDVDYKGNDIRFSESAGNVTLKNVTNYSYVRLDETEIKNLKLTIINSEPIKLSTPYVAFGQYLTGSTSLVFGASTRRPSGLTSKDVGFKMFDTTLNKPIWWTGDKWVDATGAEV